jgi:hypothetical protein
MIDSTPAAVRAVRRIANNHEPEKIIVARDPRKVKSNDRVGKSRSNERVSPSRTRLISMLRRSRGTGTEPDPRLITPFGELTRAIITAA